MTTEETRGGKHHYGTHNYPDANTVIHKSKYDVVVIGAGPAGLMTATSLARFGGYDMLVVDERSEPTTAGRADGIQPRTLEVLRNMEPLGTEFIQRGSASFERTFWDPRKDGKRGIERSRRVQSFPTSMEIQDNCTLGIQQGLIEAGFLRDMERHGQRVTRPWRFSNFVMTNDPLYPVTVTLEKMQPVQETSNEGGAPTYYVQSTGETKTVKTRYLIGCDGGRSGVRGVMERKHNVEMKGDWVDTMWAALDCVVTTNFPDIRKIAAIRSRDHGSLYIVPRETNEKGEPMIRCYIQINKMEGKKMGNASTEAKDKVSVEDVKQAMQNIAYPYQFTFKAVEWFTAYLIGQRLVSRYSLLAGKEGTKSFPAHHVFLAGDACHTHSPKAGQGMNTALIDAQALTWRINLVEKGLADRMTVLGSYHDERHATGQKLIEFDTEYSALFSGEVPKSKPEVKDYSTEQRHDYFVKVQRANAGFTTGAGVFYQDNALNHRNSSARLGANPSINHNLEAGTRLTPAWATRWVSSKPVRIIHEVQFTAPGGFRLYVCVGDLKSTSKSLHKLVTHLESPNSFLHQYRANQRALNQSPLGPYHRSLPEPLNTGLEGGFSVEVNPYFHILTLVSQSRFNFELKDIEHLGPLRAWIYADDVEAGGMRIGDKDGDESVGGLHNKWGLQQRGGIVVCRPDGYVGCVVALDDVQALERYFAGFLKPTRDTAQAFEASARL